MLSHQPAEDPLHRVHLLARRIQVRPQHLIDNRLERIQAGLAGRQLLTRLRPRRRQRLTNHPAVHVVLPRQSAHRQALRPGIPADRREQLDLGLRRHKRPPHAGHADPPTTRSTVGPQLTKPAPPAPRVGPELTYRWGRNSPAEPAPAARPGTACSRRTTPVPFQGLRKSGAEHQGRRTSPRRDDAAGESASLAEPRDSLNGWGGFPDHATQPWAGR